MADLYNSSHTGAEIDQAVSDVQTNKQAWSDKQVFIAEYGVTTQAQIEAAYAAGRMPILLKDNRVYGYSTNTTTFSVFTNLHSKFYNVDGVTVLGKEISGYQVNGSSWSDLPDKRVVTDDCVADLSATTSNWKLNTWKGNPLINLEQLNANFTTIDAAGNQLGLRLTKRETAAWAAAYHLALGALEGRHAGTLGDRRRNLILADFTKPGQWASLYHLELEGDSVLTSTNYTPVLNKPIPAATGFSQASAKIVGVEGGIGYDTVASWSPANGLVQTMATFVAKQNGTVSKIEWWGASGDSSATFALRVLEDGVQVAGDVSFSSESTFVFNSVAISFPVTAGKTYALQIVFPNASGSSFSMRNYYNATGYEGKLLPLITGTGVTYSTGYFITPEVTVKNGGTLYLWLLHSGSTPKVEVKRNSGSWLKLAGVETETATGVAGGSGTRRGYKLDNIPAGAIQLRVTLPSATSVVDEICGVIL